MSLKSVYWIIKYLYSGQTTVATDEIDEFFRTVEKLEILGLCSASNVNEAFAQNVSYSIKNIEIESDDDSDEENPPSPSSTESDFNRNTNGNAVRENMRSQRNIGENGLLTNHRPTHREGSKIIQMQLQ